MASLLGMKSGISQEVLENEATEKRLMVRDLIPHPLNRTIQPERIESLIYNIRKDGLLQPIVVNINSHDNSKEILAGHHRVKAYEALQKEDSDDKYEMIIAWTFTDLTEEEKLTIMLSTNPSYDSEEHDKIQTLKIARELYDNLVASGKRPEGRRRNWLIATTGFSEWFVRQHDETSSIVEDSPQDSDTDDSNDIGDINLDKDAIKYIKQAIKMYDWIADNGEFLSEDIKQELLSRLSDLSELGKSL